MNVNTLSLILTFMLVVWSSCRQEQHPTLEELPVVTNQSGQPNLFLDNKGELHLSWLEQVNDTLFSLNYSSLKDGQWTDPQIISKSSSWFVNWADFPSLTRSTNGWWAAHWLQISGAERFDYDVHISTSIDGQNWNSSFVIHRDSVQAEHGFVSLLPSQDGRVMAIWLDGRHTKDATTNLTDHSHGHSGTMSLRTASFDQKGQLSDEYELDSRVCDCCQTDVTMTDAGPVIVYRDRSEDDLRDMSIIRGIQGDWTQPRRVHDDRWQIHGCPVNGPAISSTQELLAVAWYTESDTLPKVLLAFSKDQGASFFSPILIDDTDPLGRVDVVVTEDGAVISWLDTGAHMAQLKIRKVSLDGKMSEEMVLSEMSANRKSGFPIIELDDSHLYVAWVEVTATGTTRIRTGKIAI